MDNHAATEQAYKNGYADGEKEYEKYLYMAFKYTEIKSIVQGFLRGCPRAVASDAALGAILAIESITNWGEDFENGNS